MVQTKVVEKIKAHILCSVFFFFGNRAVYEIIGESIVESDKPHDSMAHANYMLDT
jgi:hypothetical protein